MADTKTQFHIAIVGAGLGGLAAAISIAQGGHRATIFEQSTELGEIGAGIQIPPNSSKILKALGVLPKIESLSVRPHDFVLRSYRDGKVLSTQNTLPYTLDKYSAPYLHIHRADYHHVLVDEARRLGVDITLNSHVTGVDFSKPAVKFGGGQEDFEADLVIGADGLKSVTRETLLGRKDPPRLTGDLAYRIIVKASNMRQYPSLISLIEKPAITIWLGPDSHAVGYLLRGGDLYNIVLLCPDNLPEMVNTQKADLDEMRGIFAGWDERLRVLLGLVTESSKWRLENGRELDQWVASEGTFALLGDACHATLPYLASGAAMAVEDGYCLGLLLSRISPSPQISSRIALHDILIIYESLRKSRTGRVVMQSSHNRQIFHMHDGPRQRERDRQLMEFDSNPYEGYPNKWKDPVLQEWLWGYDVESEVERAWKRDRKSVV